MVLVNYTTRELTAKLVYYGPGLCGKTTNLQYIFENLLPPDRKGKMVSLNTETDRTLFFDFLPLELGTIRGLKTRLQLYTVPGQVHYNATRKIVLKGADGIVFVADSQLTKREGNIESYKNMKQNLAEHGLDLRNVPFVLQFNKRDLPEAMPIDQMSADLNEFNVPFWEAVAVEGIGVEDTLKGLVRLVMKNLAGRFQSDAAAAAPAAASPSAPAAPSPVLPAAAPAPSPIAAGPAPAYVPAQPPAPVFTPPAPVFTPPPAPIVTPPPPPVFTPPPPVFAPPPPPAFAPPPAPAPAYTPAPAWDSPAPRVAAASPGPLELELEAEPAEVLDLGEEQALESPSPDVGGAFDAAIASGDTIIAPGLQGDRLPGMDFTPPQQREGTAPDLEAALLSGDTVMSEAPAGLLSEMPSSLAPAAPRAPSAPAFIPPPPAPAAPAFEAPIALDSDPLGMPAGDLESALLGGGPMGGGLDLESALLGGGPVAPVAAPPPPTPTPAPAPMARPAAPPAPALEAEPSTIEVDATLQLGRVAQGELVRRIVRVPVEFQDASGTRRTTLTVRLEFRID